jgi:chemotaxis protein methyltransferase CheR
MEDRDFTTFIHRIKEQTGIDLSLYKEQQMKRRLTTLRQRRGFDSFQDFYEAMMQDQNLFYEFLDRMTINVSEFWRNPNRWETLESVFLPQLLARERNLKCWSAACSTGEEPYTLAMILAEKGVLGSAEILATDIDEGALAKAKQGVYMDRSVREVPARYLQKYFAQSVGTYRVADELKNAVRFAKQNLLADPFESNFDLIICRNVMIYFTDQAKQMLFHKFARALKPGGILFVGSTEQIFSPAQYGLEWAETFFYRKKA